MCVCVCVCVYKVLSTNHCYTARYLYIFHFLLFFILFISFYFIQFFFQLRQFIT